MVDRVMSEKTRQRIIKKNQREHERHCREWKEKGFIEIITPTGRGRALWFPEDEWHMNCGQYYGPDGMVEIFRHTDRSHLELRTVHNRKVIRRIFDKPGTKPLYSFKFIPTLCRRFLKELQNRQSNDASVHKCRTEHRVLNL